jgi:4-alpha-glucanotransferase
MKLSFRVQYHTRPGQSLWLRLTTSPQGSDVSMRQQVPMRWVNDRIWETEVDLSTEVETEIEHAYQYREEGGVVLEEWSAPRKSVIDPAQLDAVCFHDDWCSAGTVDHALETSAFRAWASSEPLLAKAQETGKGNHCFRLSMAAVPEGRVPCLLGGLDELGGWHWDQVLPMHEVDHHLWEVRVDLPDDWWIEYKYGLYDPAIGAAVSIEQGENRVLEPRQTGVRRITWVRDEAYRRDLAELPRAAGVAVPVFSLRSANGLGVGEFADLKPLADWAAAVGLRMIQILPINDTTSSHDWTDSYPYSAVSVHALHPIYLRIDDLGYAMSPPFRREVETARSKLNALDALDYEQVMKVKTALLRKVFTKHGARITKNSGFLKFVEANRDWLLPYAAFCVLRDRCGTADFTHWGEWAVFNQARVESFASPGGEAWDEASFHLWLQYELDLQLSDAVSHMHDRGVVLKGDLPIGIDRESADAWSAPHLFKMDSQAGAPPDAFAVKGQNWGFPTYDWEAMAADDYAWWRSRFRRLSRYFDAFRIDHILGFFRIWQIPRDQVEGIMGWFEPAMPIHVEEIRARGIPFDLIRYCRPYIRHHFLGERFRETADEALSDYLEDCGSGYCKLRDFVSTQRRIVDHFATIEPVDDVGRDRIERLRWGLLDCASDVLFFEVPGSNGTWFHPRCSMHATKSYQELPDEVKRKLDDLYVDYFYRRQDGFWRARGYEKLPAMRAASPMLLCGEDLGMVPDCVPGVMRDLGILSLEIQRMPKSSKQRFADPAHAPYMSVVSPSTHDMPTLRGWWCEDPHATAEFAWQSLGVAFPPLELSGELAARIIRQHLASPAMWAIFPVQDLLAMDESLRHPDVEAERINIPAITPYYWRYRMHRSLEELAAADAFNAGLLGLIRETGRD